MSSKSVEASPDRSAPVEQRLVDGVMFIAFDLRLYFRLDFAEPLGFIAEPLDRSITGDLSASAETLDEVFHAISVLYNRALRKSYGLSE